MIHFKEQRELAQLSQEELANILGVSQQTISKYENGSREAGYDMLSKMAKLFNVSIDYLLGLTSFPCTKEIEQLTKDEKKLIDTYRTLDSDEKQVVLGKAIDLKLNSAYPNKKKDIG